MIIYLAHCVAAPTPDGVKANLANARLWLRWLVRHTDHAISAPWMPYVEALDDADPAMRARGLRDDLAMLEKHEAIVLCGPRVSAGMALELEHARRSGLKECDLTPYANWAGRPPLVIGPAHAKVRELALNAAAAFDSRIGGWTGEG